MPVSRLFLEQGYTNTTITQITEQAKVTRSSFQHLFHTKDAVLTELAGTMFDGEFGVAKSIASIDRAERKSAENLY